MFKVLICLVDSATMAYITRYASDDVGELMSVMSCTCGTSCPRSANRNNNPLVDGRGVAVRLMRA